MFLPGVVMKKVKRNVKDWLYVVNFSNLEKKLRR